MVEEKVLLENRGTKVLVDNELAYGGHHDYFVDLPGDLRIKVEFQKGPRQNPDYRQGVLDIDLLYILKDRMETFIESFPNSAEYNKEALDGINKAIAALEARANERETRGVLGTEKE